jgi:hypothetical protein
VDRTCFVPEVDNVDWYDDHQIRKALPAGMIELDLTDPIFSNWQVGDFHLTPDTVLIDWGTHVVDIDPPTAGYQFLPEFDLNGQPRIVDGGAAAARGHCMKVQRRRARPLECETDTLGQRSILNRCCPRQRQTVESAAQGSLDEDILSVKTLVGSHCH